MYKRSFLIIALITSFLLIGMACQSDRQEDTENENTNSKIKEIQGKVSADSIAFNIQKLASYQTRHTASDTTSDSTGIGAARRWIYNTFERYKASSDDRLKVMYQRFIESDHPALDASTEIVNVIAMLPGTQLESKDRIYLVTAHYDSRSTNVDGSKSYAPGASDNASGTAAVLELARVMSSYEFDATIIFVAFAGKEQGLLGSTYFAEQLVSKNRHISGVINNDIIGGDGSTYQSGESQEVRVFAQGISANSKVSRHHQKLLNTGGQNDTRSHQLGRFMYRIGEKHLQDLSVSLVYRKDRLGKQGDHLPFLKHNYPAVRVTQVAKRIDQLVRDASRQQEDLPEFIDFDYVAKIAKLNATALAILADAPAPPKGVEMIIEKGFSDARFQWKRNEEPDLKGYEIVWRKTTSPYWEHDEFIGDTLRHSVEEVPKDDYIFGIRSVDRLGNKSQAVYPVLIE